VCVCVCVGVSVCVCVVPFVRQSEDLRARYRGDLFIGKAAL